MRRPLVLVFIFVVAVGLFSCGGAPDPGFEPEFESELHPMATPRWHTLESHSLTYALSPDEQAAYFALRRNNINLTETTYRYDYRTRTLSELRQTAMSAARDWELPRSAGTVGSAGTAAQAVRFEAKCRTDVQEGIRVQPDSFCIEPKGRNVVAAQRSPSGDYWFVLSADGEHYVLPANIVGFGPSKLTLLAYGQHYFQLISVAEQDLVGRDLPLGFETAGRSFAIDWVDDGHVVIAPRSYLRGEHWLAVVHVDDFVRTSGELR